MACANEDVQLDSNSIHPFGNKVVTWVQQCQSYLVLTN